MAIIGLREISLAFGGPPLFANLNLQLELGQRVALLGRNGAGKTTLMKVVAGLQPVDAGVVSRQDNLAVGFLPQEVPADISGSVYDIVLAGLGDRAQLLSEYQRVSQQLHTEHTPALLRQMDMLQVELDRTGSWDISGQMATVIDRMKLNPADDFARLSGGQKRRVLLARALVLKPEVLLLDEPTNHLDIDSIDWLEDYLRNYPGTVFFVTHDRTFMTNLATRIMDLDRGELLSWECDYKTFLQRKQAALDNENVQRGKFDKKLAQEEAWIRQGIKARRTRNEGRVKALERLREIKKAERQAVGQVRLRAQETEQSGRLVVKVEHLSHRYGEHCLIRDFSTRIMRGDKIGVIGPNGSGKTTLLRLLLGKLQPQTGEVTPGTNLEIAYYDQLREQLDEQKTVAENVCGDSDLVVINGQPRNIIGYLQNFLFTPDRARTPTAMLSGGERNRLLLAKLFALPANLLVMDEPTNDLDIETLELLEELLLEYPGTLLLVSHDRTFLNNVVTSTIALEGGGAVNEYPGGYDDWQSQRQLPAAPDQAKVKTGPATRKPAKPAVTGKLTFNEERERAALPARIAALEQEQAQLYGQMSAPAFYQLAPAEIARVKARSESLTREISAAYQRWEILEQAIQ